jgi:hypothetical protein
MGLLLWIGFLVCGLKDMMLTVEADGLSSSSMNLGIPS